MSVRPETLSQRCFIAHARRATGRTLATFVWAAGMALLVGACSADTGAPPGGDSDVSVGVDLGNDSGGSDSGVRDVAGDGSPSDVSPDGSDASVDVPIDPLCGNGILDSGEVCDDGNNFPADGCSAACTSIEVCGNGFVDPWESCDDGNNFPGDGCDGGCNIEVGCGNGLLEIGEQCDDGNLDSGDGCSVDCQRETVEVTDTDGDGISDFDEGSGGVDSDGDGTPDSLDLDSDNDGIPDAVEAGDSDISTSPVDTDNNGTPNFRDQDSDGDTIPDSYEGTVDTDSDGKADYVDVDSDGDFVPDELEGTVDNDSDGLEDFRDQDSDDDLILDAHELYADSDEDGTPNRIDLDSDNDGLSDTNEAGDFDIETYPVDTDNDGQPDYIDTDSDGDGLPDDSEPGCPAGPDARNADSDGDGYSDLAEQLVGSNACTFTSQSAFEVFTDFFFVLPEGDPPQDAPLEFSSNIQQADVAINVDTTGSMNGEITAVRTTLGGTIIPGIRGQITDVGFGISSFDDVPCSGHGSGSDRAFILRQRVTTSSTSAQNGVNLLALHNGQDGAESGYESLYQIATGAGGSYCSPPPPFNPSLNRVAGVADGTIGGVGFRSNSFPVVIHITDAESHNGHAGTRNSTTTTSALQGIQARVIGVVSSGGFNTNTAVTQLTNLANATGARVPVCAWDGARPAGCASNQCCTGLNGAGQTASGGMCPLVFRIDGNGSGMGAAMVTAVGALVNTSTLEVTTTVRRDPDEFAATGVDTSCFIQSIIPNRFVGSGTCTTIPTPADINPVDGVNDGFRNVTPGTQLFFDVVAENNVCVPAESYPQSFEAYIDVVGDGITILDSLLVTIIVPPEEKNPTTVP